MEDICSMEVALKKVRIAGEVPSVVAERLPMWGAATRKQRVAMNITADDLCGRLATSRPTLRRMEQGDPSVSASLYLACLNVVGLLGHAAPRMESHLWESTTSAPRARGAKGVDDDYF